ncbi:MAG: peptidylprolyl isomerase [Sphingomonadales bacterium]|nr:peptidylprolyl isomerase [Sphingomonadales bacterium]MDE2568891.1 peptidylprolyl isomerase [Sphingomonadales bacterium]
MKRRFVLAALPAVLLLAAAAPKRKPLPEPPLPDSVDVALTTELGTIVVELDGKHAPITVRNFLHYVDQKRFDGIAFYRAMHLAWGEQPNGLIQAGTQGDPRRVLPPIAHEPTSLTGIHHTAGAISMARNAPGTATGEFSILLSDLDALDADPASADPDRQAGYAAFGHVVSGMDVVKKIWESPLSPTRGEGAMKGQMLDPQIRILTARRVPAPVATAAPGS